jgi:uncharacterized protein (TIGR02444 family)
MPHTHCVVEASEYNKYRVAPPAASVTLRQFAIAVHEAEGVPASCVSLQDRFGLDVNVLLVAAYLGTVLRQMPTAEQLRSARALVDGWHGEVVRPLRGVRRLLKAGPEPAPSAETDAVRSQVAKAELDAELIELDVLDGWAAGLAPSAIGPSSELAVAAMEVAVRSYSPEPLGDDERHALAVIASAAMHYLAAS